MTCLLMRNFLTGTVSKSALLQFRGIFSTVLSAPSPHLFPGAPRHICRFSALSSTHLHLGGKLDLLSSKPVCDCGNKAPLPQFKTYITQDQLLEMTHRSRSCSSRRRKVFELPLLQRCTELWLGGDCLNVPNYWFPN